MSTHRTDPAAPHAAPAPHGANTAPHGAPDAGVAAAPAASRGTSASRVASPNGPLRVGIGGPVGVGKTTLLAALCRALAPRRSLGVVTNDIYTVEDAEALVRAQALPSDRIVGVETGGCPHTAIREDASLNLAAIAELRARHADLDLVLVESGGDNLSATFSPDLVDATIYVISTCGGGDVPRKRSPALARADMLVVTKTALAPHVGVDLEAMRRDAEAARGGRPCVFAELPTGEGVPEIVAWLDAAIDPMASPTLDPAIDPIIDPVGASAG